MVAGVSLLEALEAVAELIPGIGQIAKALRLLRLAVRIAEHVRSGSAAGAAAFGDPTLSDLLRDLDDEERS